MTNYPVFQVHVFLMSVLGIFQFLFFLKKMNYSNLVSLYIGLFLQDLTFIEEGNPDNLENGYVNFAKFRMVADVIIQIQKFQRKPYNLAVVPTITSYLLSHKPLTEKVLFEMSLSAEPREPKTTP